MEDEQDDGTRQDSDEGVVLARRRLLKAAVYVAPAVLSAVVVERASAQPSPSCSPPCAPKDPDCGPPNRG